MQKLIIYFFTWIGLSLFSVTTLAAAQVELRLIIISPANPVMKKIHATSCIILDAETYEKNHPKVELPIPTYRTRPHAYISYKVPQAALNDKANPMLIACNLYLGKNAKGNEIHTICHAKPTEHNIHHVPCVIQSTRHKL